MKNNKKRIVLTILTIILGLGISLGAIYYIYYMKDQRENSLNSGLVRLNFTEGNNNINLLTIPMVDDEGLKGTPYTFTLENTSSVPVNAKIKLELNNTSNIDLGAVRYAIFINEEKIKKDYVHDNLILYEIDKMFSGQTINVKLYFWVDYYYDKPDKIFSAKIVSEGENIDRLAGLDNVAPTLTLEKETCVEEDFSNWNLGNAYVDANGILNLGTNGNTAFALSPFYPTDGKKWKYIYDAYTESVSELKNPKGAVFDTVNYYDENKVSVVATSGSASAGNSSNGWAPTLELGEWRSSLTHGGELYYSPNVFYIKIGLYAGGNYSATVKIRNFKICTSVLRSDFYNIIITSNDNVGIVETKYAKGNRDEAYFKENGTPIDTSEIRVTENGTYSVYVKDANDNYVIKTIDITNIG